MGLCRAVPKYAPWAYGAKGSIRVPPHWAPIGLLWEVFGLHLVASVATQTPVQRKWRHLTLPEFLGASQTIPGGASSQHIL
eukprot:9479649-Pyramimonas_sp.AAC.1